MWGQLKIITAMLILNLVFNFAICTDMMTKKPIQSDINDEPLISKIMYLAIMIKIDLNLNTLFPILVMAAKWPEN